MVTHPHSRLTLFESFVDGVRHKLRNHGPHLRVRFADVQQQHVEQRVASDAVDHGAERAFGLVVVALKKKDKNTKKIWLSRVLKSKRQAAADV